MSIEKMIATTVRRYKRKVWRADEEDMTQIAWVAVEETRQTFDAARGFAFAGYAHRAVCRAITEYLWRSGSPVSEAEKRLPTLIRIESVEVDAALPQETERPETHGIWLDHVRRTIEEATADIRDARLALRVLLEEKTPAEVAREEGVAVRRVYKATHAARNAIRRNEELALLWEEGA
jgi:DNA-directed RNA polymerase specialized sigma24 family protein